MRFDEQVCSVFEFWFLSNAKFAIKLVRFSKFVPIRAILLLKTNSFLLNRICSARFADPKSCGHHHHHHHRNADTHHHTWKARPIIYRGFGGEPRGRSYPPTCSARRQSQDKIFVAYRRQCFVVHMGRIPRRCNFGRAAFRRGACIAGPDYMQ